MPDPGGAADTVPCKHIAATFYLLAESFDDDPFAILLWRGRGREAAFPAVPVQAELPTDLLLRQLPAPGGLLGGPTW